MIELYRPHDGYFGFQISPTILENKLRVFISGFGHGLTDKLFTGQVWQVSPTISEQDRQGTARIALSYAPGLRPGPGQGTSFGHRPSPGRGAGLGPLL